MLLLTVCLPCLIEISPLLMLPLFGAVAGECLHQEMLLLHLDLYHMYGLVEIFCKLSPMNSNIPWKMSVWK